MSRFSILMLAVAFCLFTQQANAQSKTTAQPKIIDQKTWVWKPSTFNHAKLNDLVFEVGMGNHPNGGGAAYAGIEIENASIVKVKVETPLPFIFMDDNSLAGFMVDYHTAGGYTKRVALAMGLFSKKRGVPGPIAWGKAKPPDQFVDLGKKKEYYLDLKEWAPQGWDGKVWFSVSLQNSGRNTILKAKVEFHHDKIVVAQKPKEEPGKKEEKKTVKGKSQPTGLGLFRTWDGNRIRVLESHWEFTKEGRVIQDGDDIGTWTLTPATILRNERGFEFPQPATVTVTYSNKQPPNNKLLLTYDPPKGVLEGGTIEFKRNEQGKLVGKKVTLKLNRETPQERDASFKEKQERQAAAKRAEQEKQQAAERAEIARQEEEKRIADNKALASKAVGQYNRLHDDGIGIVQLTEAKEPRKNKLVNFLV